MNSWFQADLKSVSKFGCILPMDDLNSDDPIKERMIFLTTQAMLFKPLALSFLMAYLQFEIILVYVAAN